MNLATIQVDRAHNVGAAASILARALTGPSSFATASGVWSDISANAADDNAFCHPAFLEPASKALGIEANLLSMRAADGRVVGLMPLARSRIGHIAPVLQAVAHDYAPLGVPVIRQGNVDDAADGLIGEALARAGSGVGLLLPMLPADSTVTAALATAAAALGRTITRLDTHERAMLDRHRDGTDPRHTLPLRRRKEYARQMRRLEEVGPVTIDVAEREDEIRARFEEFLDLEAAGWKGRRGTALKDRAAIAAFARKAIAALAEDGACKVFTLRVGDRAAAMLICFFAGRTASTWKIAYDESLSRFSPGAQLMLDAPPLLFADDRIERIDSCAAPNHPMIDHLWRGRLRLTTLAISPADRRARFRAGIAVHRAEERLRRLARDVRRRFRSNSSKPRQVTHE